MISSAAVRIGSVWVALACIYAAGCNSRPQPSSDSASEVRHAESSESTAPERTAAPASSNLFDFYLLNLSWSPEYCHSHPGAVECAEHPGFVVHGLWPQNNDGSYPKDCGAAPGPAKDAAWQGLFASGALARHEWEAHGTCTGLAPESYFALVRRARNAVHIPAEFTAAQQPSRATPDEIAAQFAAINPGIPSGGIAISCGHNYLSAVEVCFDKALQPIACRDLRSCRAGTVRIAPREGGEQHGSPRYSPRKSR